MDFTNSPDYLKAADLHNLGSGSPSFFTDPVANIADKVDAVGNAIVNAPNFAISSIASGINSIYNSAVVAGNWLGVSDAEENDLERTLSSYDSDLGKYYSANKASTDLAGFVVTSFIPGLGGIKLFNAGQEALRLGLKTGSLGKNIAEGTGLIRTVTADGKSLATIAGEALAQSQQSFGLLNAGVLKAIGSGVAQAAWESAAFEVFVAASMFRSPVLAEQDFKDIGLNILTGTALGGAIGGVFASAHVYGDIRRAISKQDLIDKEQTLLSSTAHLDNKPSTRIIINTHDAENTPVAVGTRAETMRTQRLQKLEEDNTLAAHQLAGDNVPIGQLLSGFMRGQSAEQIARMYQGLTRVFHPLEVVKLQKGFREGYVKVHGEGAGDVSFDAIKGAATTLADRFPTKKAILDFVEGQDFSTSKAWRMFEASSRDEIEARYIWARKQAAYEDGMLIHESDIPLLEGAALSKIDYFELIKDTGNREFISRPDMEKLLEVRKRDVANILEKTDHPAWPKIPDPYGVDPATKSITSADIARAVNVSPKWLESTDGASYLARQDAQAAWEKYRADRGIVRGESDIDYIPQNLKLLYDTRQMITANADLTTAMTYIKYRQKIQQEAVDRAFARLTGNLFERFFHPGEDAILNSNRYGAGAGLFKFANGAYGTLASWAEVIGKATDDLVKQIKGNTAAHLDSVTLRLRTDQVAAIEFDKINNLVASSTEKYVLAPDRSGLIAEKTLKYRTALAKGETNVEVPVLQQGAPETIPFLSELTAEAVRARISSNGLRVTHLSNLRRAVGIPESKSADVFYPLKPQPRDYPFFAFVKDETVTGESMGHTSMLHATDEVRLDEMMKMAREKGFKVYTKADTENFYKVQKEYEYDRTLHDNYMDASLKSAGVNNQFFPKTNPDKIVDGWLELERRADEVLAREAVSTKFGHEFDQLETLGGQYTNIASSRYGTTAARIESTTKNPYNDYRKTALNISRLSEYPLLIATNRMLETAVSGAYQRVADVWAQSKSVNDLEAVNTALMKAGVNHAYKNAAEVVLANHSAPRSYVSEFVRGANAILANTFLRLDPLNALNNAIGSQVLLGHETSGQVRALLKDIAGVTVPGTSDSMLSPSKLIAAAMKNWYGASDELRQVYKSNGWLTRLSDQQRAMIDDLSLSGAETPVQLRGKLNAAFEKAKELTDLGEKATGNKMAEEFNRFVAADVARQISDVRINAGLMDANGQKAFINTFVNRTQGNILAAQRPLIFQGPIGQAIGLFQTFQFNTMQQLFRSVSEGASKDVAMAMGLQGTMYGLNGLPAFQYINQHIIGTASGNKEHVDAYSTIYGAAGKTVGDWLMYGVPSNILQTNLYSRGDINPRQLTIIPTNPADIVAVSAFSKFAANLKETLGKVVNGGNVWQSVLQGLEHNTISRPLSGLAVTLQGIGSGQAFSTTNAGDISFVNDLLSLGTLSRLSGGKPLDEALANDQVARSMVYQAADRERMHAATEAFKTNLIGTKNGTPTEDAVHSYMEEFVKNGGRKEQFNKTLLTAMTRVNTPRANEVIKTLKGSYSQSMKDLMGGGVQELEEPTQ
jgi:hypothetical protein